MPCATGMTMGELARLFNEENKIGAGWTIIPMQSWRRDEWFDETGLTWINPSPNMRNLIQATLYPGVGAIETTNISVGRGTDTPFEQIGAPWIDGSRLAEELNAQPPVRASASTRSSSRRRRASTRASVSGRVPHRDRSAGAPAGAGRDRDRVGAVPLHGDKFELYAADRLLGSRADLRTQSERVMTRRGSRRAGRQTKPDGGS